MMGNSLAQSFYNMLLPEIAADLQGDMNEYLQSLKTSRVRSLKELVDWNFAHKDEALTTGRLQAIVTTTTIVYGLLSHPDYPNQDWLISALAFGDSVEKRDRIMAHVQRVGLRFEETFTKYNIDAIIGPSDSALCLFSAARGKQVKDTGLLDRSC